MKIINPDMKIAEILTHYPETLAVFKANGFPADTRDQLLEQLSPLLTLKTALQVKGLNAQVFIGLLEENIRESRIYRQMEDAAPSGKSLDFLGYTYCPLKYTFKDCFEEVRQKYLADNRDSEFHYFVPSGCGEEEDPYREGIWQIQDIDDFPAITVAAGFNDAFGREFVDRFVQKGYFKRVASGKVSADFAAVGYEDPAGWYTMYSALPLVMLVDRKKLGDLPVPGQWSDLLNPVYQHNIIIGATQGNVHEDLLLYIYKEHGEEGIAKLAANVKAGMHGAEMAKMAGIAGQQGAAIYVIAWLFAKACPYPEATTIVWPTDGALITPMYLLVKETMRKDLQPFVDFVTGSWYGQKSADNYFPVLHSSVDNRLPPQAGFKWLGWDYIRSHSMENLKKHVVEVYRQAGGKV